MNKEKNSLRSRVWRRMNATAQQRYEDVQEIEKLKEIGRKAQARVDREVKDITGAGIGREYGDRVVLDSTLIQRENLPVPNSASIMVEEISDVTEEEFHRMMLLYDIAADPFSEVSGRIKRETFGPRAESLVGEDAIRFLSTGHVKDTHVEEVDGDDAAALLYFSDRNTRG